MEDYKSNKLWRTKDENNVLLFTVMPNCFMQDYSRDNFTNTEKRILTYICRLSWGFKSKYTYYLNNDDFERETGLKKSHVSNSINRLLKRKVIIRTNKNGSKYRYAVDLSLYGYDYKGIIKDNIKRSEDDGKRNKDYEKSNENYGKCTNNNQKSNVSNSSKGCYESSEKPYINTYRNKNRKKKIKTFDEFLISFEVEIRANNDINIIVEHLKVMKEKYPKENIFRLQSIYYKYWVFISNSDVVNKENESLYCEACKLANVQ